MTKLLRLSLLGAVNLELDGRPLTGLPSRAAEALLIYLACHKRPFSRETLAELLWAERSPQQALTNLRTILSALRRELGDHLLIQRDTLAFNREADFWLDADGFERGLAKLAPAIQSVTPLDDSTAGELQAILALYQGDFLSGFAVRDGPGFEEWLSLEQERLRRLAHSGFRRMARHFLEIGDYPAGLRNAYRWMGLDAYDEEACRTLMWLLARAGQRNAALVQYETLRRTLSKDLGVPPAPDTSQLYQRLRELTSPPPNNLPPPAEFIGRQSELAELNTRLAQPACRLISLLGPGGIGKTRLALECARRVAEARPGQFLDGIFFIPLENLPAAHNLALRLGEVVGVHFGSSEAPRTQLLAWLKEKELLLILDNFEHLLDAPDDAAALLADILAQAPGVKLLVTSRQRLNLVEEWIFDVSGLALPHPGQADPLSVSAALLFVQVARRLQRQFAPSADEIGAIVQICRVLDGLPLALELAAAWTRQQSCVEIAAQVQASLDFLQATQRNASERRRSLRGVFDHSWSLLDAAQQSVFARLSVLRGDFDRPAASATLGSESLPMLAGLLDHSLVQRRADGRYALHPTLRQYAAEKLALDSAQQEVTHQRHAAYFLGWLAEQGNGESPDQRAAIRAEMENLRPAWEWAAQRKEHNLLERAAPVLHNFYSAESWFVEGIEAFQLALDGLRDEASAQAPLVCDLLGRQARMQIHIGQIAAARTGLERAYMLLEHVPQAERRATILGYQAITHYYAGDYARAAELAGQALAISQIAGDLEGTADGLNFLGSCHKARGAYDLAHQSFEQSVAAYRQMPDPLGEAMVLNNLGNLAQAGGDFDSARQYYIQSSELFKAQDHAHGASTTLSNAGLLAYHQGAYDQARALLNESLAMKQKMADQRGIAIALLRLGDVATALGEYDPSRQQLIQALTLAQQTGDFKLALEILVAVADLCIHTRQENTARRYLAFVLQQTATSQEARQRASELADALKITTATRQENPGLTYESILLELLGEIDVRRFS